MLRRFQSLLGSTSNSLALEQDDTTRQHRTAASGPGWSEVFVSPTQAQQTAQATEAVAQGFSLLLLHGLASADECETLRSEASKEAFRLRFESLESSYEAIGEVTPNHSSDVPQQVRRPITEMLGMPGQALCDRLLLRGIARLTHELPALLPKMFDGFSISKQSRICENPGLVFTPGEPACNVYTKGGQFVPHEDKQCLTILVPLSDLDAFTDGGTGFWSEEHRDSTRGNLSGQDAIDAHGPPSFVLKQAPGTALVFGGGITHSARVVTMGERVVFVASFSPVPDGAPAGARDESWVASLGGQSKWVQWLGAFVAGSAGAS